MNRYSCEVRLVDNNQLNLTSVEKTNVSAAEIVILRHIHGDDRVANIRFQNRDKELDFEEEYDRLRNLYPKRIEQAGKMMPLIEALFPRGPASMPDAVAGIKLPKIGEGDLNPAQQRGEKIFSQPGNASADNKQPGA